MKSLMTMRYFLVKRELNRILDINIPDISSILLIIFLREYKIRVKEYISFLKQAVALVMPYKFTLTM